MDSLTQNPHALTHEHGTFEMRGGELEGAPRPREGTGMPFLPPRLSSLSLARSRGCEYDESGL